MKQPTKYPVTFAVTNTGKRTRLRNGRRFPGKKGNATSTVQVEVRNRTEYLRLKGCKSLQLAAGSAAPTDDEGDGLDKLTVDELDERLKAAELPTDGKKVEKVDRLREHQAESGQ